MSLDPALITARVTGILEKLNVRYLICGSLASTLHGMVRTTQDSGILAELRSEADPLRGTACGSVGCDT